jgi:hypothetical protein
MSSKKPARKSKPKPPKPTQPVARKRQRPAERESLPQPLLAAADPKDRPLVWWRDHWSDAAVRRQFMETFIYVRNAFEQNRLTPLRFNDLQADLHDRVTGRDVILKFRRGGVSRYWLASYLSDAVVNAGRNVRFVPHDPDTEDEFRADLRMMYEQLPESLRPATKYYSKELIWFEDEACGTVDSRLTTASVQPGHEGKGRGQTLTNLLLTEPPHWRGNPQRAATSLMEAAAGGRVAVESTAFGIEWFHSIYQDGKTGKGGWRSHFYEWWWMRHYRQPGARFIKEPGAKNSWLLLGPDDRRRYMDPQKIGAERARAAMQAKVEPARVTATERLLAKKILKHLVKLKYAEAGSKWNCSEVAAYVSWRRAKIEELPGGERQFLVEFPENDVDCFEQTGRPVISSAYLKVTCKPSGPVHGSTYYIGCDPSVGLEYGDPAAIQILDKVTGRQVHEELLKRPPDLLADRLAELSDEYNGATIVVERNGPGIATIRRLVDLGYGRLLYRFLDSRTVRSIEDGQITSEEAKHRVQEGFPTTSANKALLGIELEQGLRIGKLGLSSQAFCDEARSVVWFDNNKFGALPGHHDDRFMALAILWYAMNRPEPTSFLGIMPVIDVDNED